MGQHGVVLKGVGHQFMVQCLGSNRCSKDEWSIRGVIRQRNMEHEGCDMGDEFYHQAAQ
jgi:hypothetical protein